MFSLNVLFSSADILGDILGKVKGNKIVDQSSNMFHICQVIVLVPHMPAWHCQMIPLFGNYCHRLGTNNPCSMLCTNRSGRECGNSSQAQGFHENVFLREAVSVPGREGVKEKFFTALERYVSDEYIT